MSQKPLTLNSSRSCSWPDHLVGVNYPTTNIAPQPLKGEVQGFQTPGTLGHWAKETFKGLLYCEPKGFFYACEPKPIFLPDA